MDINCSRCGEPWSIDCIHDTVLEIEEMHGPQSLKFADVHRAFQRFGCAVIIDATTSPAPARLCARIDGGTAALAAALNDVLGDDVDGIASELADAQYMGWL